MLRVKICGITRIDDARIAADAGADLLGLNFVSASPRRITPKDAATICDALRAERGDACPVLVGVFVNTDVSHVTEIIAEAGLDAVQFSGDESSSLFAEMRVPAYKAIQPPNEAMAIEDANYYAPSFPTDERVPSLLLDAYHPTLRGGTGAPVSAAIAASVKAVTPRLMLAGGLTPDNVAERVTAAQPWGVDVASGVEDDQPGVKSADKLRAFIRAAKGETIA